MSHQMSFAGALALALSILVPNAASAASDPTGIWMNDTGRGAVEIKKCGKRLCGHVVWVKDEKDTDGCGRQIIGNVGKVRDGMWDRGWIYSPERKRRYDVELRPLKNGNLRVKGYAGTKLFSKTMIWKPAPADLKLCGDAGQVAKTEKSNGDDKAAAPAKKKEKVAARTVDEKPAVKKSTARKATIKETPAASETKSVGVADDDIDAGKRSSKNEIETAEVQPEGDDEVDTVSEGGKGGLDLGGLDIDKYFKKSGGRCKLNTPWIKLDFDCKDL